MDASSRKRKRRASETFKAQAIKGRCSMCKREGKAVEDYGHCDKCKVNLCDDCFRDHWKSRLRSAPHGTAQELLPDKPVEVKPSRISAKDSKRHSEKKATPVYNSNENPGNKRYKTVGKNILSMKATRIDVIHFCIRESNRRNYKSYVPGMLSLPGGKLLIVDHYGQKLALISSATHKVLSELPLADFPWDLTMINKNEVAITSVREEKIIFVNVSMNNTMTKIRDIKMNGHCRGIAYSDDKLIVCFDYPIKLETISLQGEVITSTDLSAAMFRPGFLKLGSDDKTVYIVDTMRWSLTKATSDGQILAKYTKNIPLLAYVDNLCLGPEGYVFVCDHSKNQMLLVSPDCETTTVLIRDVGLAWEPLAVAWCSKTDKLYVATWYNNIHVYQLTY